MKTDHTKDRITLGEFIMGVYDACTAQKAGEIVWLAIQGRLVVIQGRVAWRSVVRQDASPALFRQGTRATYGTPSSS